MSSTIYPTAEEAGFRLNSTIVEYEGLPCYIHRAENHPDEIIRLRTSMLPYPDAGAPKVVNKKITDPGFRRFQTIGLGWCNHFAEGIHHASFIERVPARRSKQGLDSGSFKSSRPLVGSSSSSSDDFTVGVRYNELFHSIGFIECAQNRYPLLREALYLLKEDSSIAVSRDFLVVKTENGLTALWYKKQACGVIIKGRIFLYNKFEYLKETIENNSNLTTDVEIGV